MKKKTIFLFLALLLPVSVFIFLKIFGRNEFRVPVLHAEGKIDAVGDCRFAYQAPYRLPDSVIAPLNLAKNDSLYVFYFDSSIQTAMHRITVEFEGAPIHLVSPSTWVTPEDREFFKRCVLLMESGVSVALVDHMNRIRGYYNGADRDEVDRLIVEMKIILRKY